ncbi:hypothetical protein SAMN05444126_1451 [Salisediminibacterium halotolerans]|uniref:Uncharacterized protein n=1 Tax=Salisediminibacterium halotolerans TaxID=517425 RepID=A0A1H9WRQ8_9BACI|nr:hypothetical protein SAMN05444126_1451 [Salisediminibacterium haloalkalitolerans]
MFFCVKTPTNILEPNFTVSKNPPVFKENRGMQTVDKLYFYVSHESTTLRLPRARTQLVFGGLRPPNTDLRLLLSRRRRRSGCMDSFMMNTLASKKRMTRHPGFFLRRWKHGEVLSSRCRSDTFR